MQIFTRDYQSQAFHKSRPPPWGIGNHRRSVGVVGVILALTLGLLIGVYPMAGLALAGGLALTFVLAISSRGRLLIVVLGGLLVFQSNDGLGPTKYAYLAAAVSAVAISLISLSRSSDPVIRCFRPLLFASLSMLIVLCMSAIVANAEGTLLTEWGRDIVPYFFLISLPAVALDASQHFKKKQVEALLVALGLAAAAGFAIDWIDRRHVSSFVFGRLILATTTLAALGFAYTLMRASVELHRLRWILLSALIMALMIVSGTRTNLVFLAAALGMIGSTTKARIPMRKLLTTMALVILLVVASIPILTKMLTDDPSFLGGRTRGAISVLEGNLMGDASFQARAESYAVAKDVLTDSPLVGVGPGYAFPTSQSYAGSTASLDTPWLVPAKFGIIGVLALILYFASVLVCMARLRQGAGWVEIFTVGRGWFAILLFLTPFGPWIEDKGFALALALYLGAVAASVRESMDEEKGDAIQHGAQNDNLPGTRRRSHGWARLADSQYSSTADPGRHLAGAATGRRIPTCLSDQ
jgi:hypothetical protein